MEYSTRKQAQYSVIILTGEVDLQVSPQVRKQVLDTLGTGENVLVDLAGVEYIDSSGIASLVEGLKVARDKQLEFGLIAVSSAAMQVLSLARLDQVFSIHESVEQHITATQSA